MAVRTAEKLPLSKVPQFEATEKQKEWDRNNNIFHDSINLGVDYAFATNGKLPSINNLAALHINSWLPHTPDEVLIACQCDSIIEFQELVKTAYCDELIEKQAYEEQILLEINEARQANTLPDALFQEVVYSKSFIQLEREDQGSRSKFNMGFLLDLEVPDGQKIVRYKRWQLVHNLIAGAGAPLEPERALNIVLGFNISSGNRLSTFSSEVCKSNNLLTPADLELAAIGPDYDYIFPVVRTELEAAILDDSRSFALSLIDEKPRHRDALYSIPPETLMYDMAGQRIIVELKEGQKENKRVVKLGQLVVERSVKIRPVHLNKQRFRGWGSEEFRKYGLFLKLLAESVGGNLVTETLRRAHSAGLGPGIKSMVHSNDVGSVSEFFSLAERRRVRASSFPDMGREDYLELAKRIADEEGDLTNSIIRQRLAKGLDEPSPAMWFTRAGGINKIRDQLGLITRTLDSCKFAGVAFYREHGHLPTYPDFKDSDYLPSLRTMYRHCGSIEAYRKLIMIELGEQPEESIAA